jgi:hypothetical protein
MTKDEFFEKLQLSEASHSPLALVKKQTWALQATATGKTKHKGHQLLNKNYFSPNRVSHPGLMEDQIFDKVRSMQILCYTIYQTRCSRK